MGLHDAAGDGRLEDVKEHAHNGVDVNKTYRVSNYIYTYLIHIRLDLQIKAWVGHYACVAETGLATQYWSDKSEGCT